MDSTIFDILNALSDRGALSIFKIISVTKNTSVTSDSLMAKLKLTRKQYYSRTMHLMKAGLIYRMKGKFFLTSLGKVTYNFIIKFEDIINNYWKLKAIDSIQMSYANRYMSKEEFSKIVNDLIDDYEIRDILLSQEQEEEELNNKQVEELPINNSDKYLLKKRRDSS
jgi:predicted transcriptional regulator